jgi:hypothetical protein
MFFNLPINEILNWVSTIVSDLMPLIVVILGIGIGFWIIRAILRIKD